MRLEKKVKAGICAVLIGITATNGVQLYAEDKPRAYYDFSGKGFFEFELQGEGLDKEQGLGKLIEYTIKKYSPLIQEAKKTYPDYTFEELVKDSSFGNKLRFVWLTAVSYAGNLSKLNYILEGEVDMDGDYLLFYVSDESKKERYSIKINVVSNPEAVRIEDIGEFLKNKKKSITGVDKNKNFMYSITRERK